MIKRWIAPLLTLLTLLWTRLPGLPGRRRPGRGPSRSDLFSCRQGEGDENILAEGQLFWLSKHTQGITIQMVTRYQRGWRALEEKPVESWVTVKSKSLGTAELNVFNSEVRQRLLKGSGCYAIVTGRVMKERFYREADIIVEREGIDLWKIVQ